MNLYLYLDIDLYLYLDINIDRYRLDTDIAIDIIGYNSAFTKKEILSFATTD